MRWMFAARRELQGLKPTSSLSAKVAAKAATHKDCVARFLAFCERFRCDDSGAFFHGDDLIGGNILELVHLAAGPADFDGVGLRLRAETKSEHEFARGEIARAAGSAY